MYGSLSEALGEQVTPQTSVAQLREYADKLELDVDPAHYGHGKLVEELWEHLVGDHLTLADVRARLPAGDHAADPRPPQRARASPRSGTCTCAASSWPPATPSWSTR